MNIHLPAFTLWAAILTVLLSGCSKSDPKASSPDTPSAASSVIDPSAPAVELKAKWPLGNRYTYRMDLVQKVATTLPQLPKPMEQDISMGSTYSLAVVKERDGGGREMELEFVAQEMDVKMGEQVVISFDSKSDPSEDRENPFAGSFRKLMGRKIQILLDANNSVESVEGLEELIDIVTENSPPQSEMMIRQTYTPDYFRQLVEIGKGFPEKPVKPGETWPFQTEITAGPLGRLKMDLTMRLAGTQERNAHQCALLEQSGTMKTGGDATGGPMGKMSIEKGKVSGKTWFDPELGAVIETASDQTMVLKVEMPGGGPAGSPAINSDITQTVTLKLVDLTKSTK